MLNYSIRHTKDREKKKEQISTSIYLQRIEAILFHSPSSSSSPPTSSKWPAPFIDTNKLARQRIITHRQFTATKYINYNSKGNLPTHPNRPHTTPYSLHVRGFIRNQFKVARAGRENCLMGSRHAMPYSLLTPPSAEYFPVFPLPPMQQHRRFFVRKRMKLHPSEDVYCVRGKRK